MVPKKYLTGISENKISRIELRKIINMKHPLVLLSKSINWNIFENMFNKTYNQKIGRPGLNTRLMVALHYLKYTYNLSYESVIEFWKENPYWQCFSGMECFINDLPIHPSSMTRWRKRIGENGAEELLKQTIKTGFKLNIIDNIQFKKINIDTTVQKKYVQFPTDSKLYYKMTKKLIKVAKKLGIKFKKNYNKSLKYLLYKKNYHTYNRNYIKIKEYSNKLKKCLGNVIKNFKYKNLKFNFHIKLLLDMANRLYKQKKYSKNKIYSIHAPEVECIVKKTIKNRYQFGNKVSIATTSHGGWIIGAKSFHGNPYDGHTLNQALKQIIKLGQNPEYVFVDRGYKGHNYSGEIPVYISSHKKRSIPNKLKYWLKRRVAIEPTIGHLKFGHMMDYNRLKGKLGDCMNSILSAAGMNFIKLLKT